MGVYRPQRRDTAAFQLVSVLEQFDLEVARLELNPGARSILTTGNDHLARARSLCEELGVPAAGPADLEGALKSLLRQIGHPAGPGDLRAPIAEVRSITEALRAVCVAIVSKNAPL